MPKLNAGPAFLRFSALALAVALGPVFRGDPLPFCNHPVKDFLLDFIHIVYAFDPDIPELNPEFCRNPGRIDYCQNFPHRLHVTISRMRDKNGQWGIWYLVSNQSLRARQAAKEYGFRFGCEEGFRDVKWDLGFKESRVRQIHAWSRLFALFAIALAALDRKSTRLNSSH